MWLWFNVILLTTTLKEVKIQYLSSLPLNKGFQSLSISHHKSLRPISLAKANKLLLFSILLHLGLT